MWVCPSICYGHHRGCLNNPIFSNLGVMCCILRAGGCQTCGTHISVTVWCIFSIRSSVELSRLVGVHCQGHMPICPIWACPWAKNFSNLPQIGSRLSGMHISETARLVGVHCQGHMPICPIWACPWAKNFSNLPQIGSRLSGMHISETAGLIDMERKGYESIGCYTCFVSSSFDLDPGFSSRCGLGTFLSWWPPSTMWVCPSICYGHHRGCLNNPIFSNLGVMHISETAGWIYPIQSFMDLSRPVVVQRHSCLPICPIWPCPWAKNLSNEAALGSDFAEPISLKPLDGFIPFRVLWNCLDL